MCGGRYHGVAYQRGGLERAMQAYEEEICAEATRRARAEGVDVTIRSVTELFGQRRLFVESAR